MRIVARTIWTTAGAAIVSTLLGLVAPDRGLSETAQTAALTWDQTIAAAKREGSLKIAGHPSDLRRNAFMEFAKAYPGITIEYVSIGSHGQADARLKAEWDAKAFNWDILASGQEFIYSTLTSSKALVPIRDIIRDDIKDDRHWKDGFAAGFLDKEQRYVFGFMIYIAGSAHANTKVYPLSSFKSVHDLLDPKYKGKIAWADPRAGGVAEIMVSFLYQHLGSEGLRYLLTKQDPKIMGSPRQLLNSMVRGQTPIGVGVTSGTHRQMIEAGLGADIQTIDFPDDRNVGRSGGILAVPKSAPHPNAAKVFANWLLSLDGQTSWTKFAKENSARLDAPVGDPLRYPDPKLKWFTWDKEEVDFFDKYQLPARKLVAEILGNKAK
jgi:iron(III) transport system substrate-binding protein